MSDEESQRLEGERVELKKLDLIKNSLAEHQIELNLHFHDELEKREILTNHGCKIQSSHGLHFYQERSSLYHIGAFAMSLRPCKETRLDFFSLLTEQRLDL